jgi:uncharacterized peroxidase-related enzyme
VDRALCDYAVKLTLAPGKVTAADIHRLRQLGLNDEQVVLATQVVSYFNYINRIADGLGVEPEPWMKMSKADWLRRKSREYEAS